MYLASPLPKGQIFKLFLVSHDYRQHCCNITVPTSLYVYMYPTAYLLLGKCLYPSETQFPHL